MDINQLKLSELAIDKLNTLALTVELLEKKRFRPRKNFDELVELAKVASQSAHQEITQKFSAFTATLTEDQRSCFKVLGIEVDAAVASRDTKGRYRGASQSIAQIAGSDVVTEGKKRVIYRGQVKWV